MEVGEHLKRPRAPIWVVCSESHFTILFLHDVSQVFRVRVLHWKSFDPNPLDHRDDFSRPALCHGSLNSLSECHIYLSSQVFTSLSCFWFTSSSLFVGAGSAVCSESHSTIVCFDQVSQESRCRASMARVRQSRPGSGLGFQVKVLKHFRSGLFYFLQVFLAAILHV